jgi:hypothetical protein
VGANNITTGKGNKECTGISWHKQKVYTLMVKTEKIAADKRRWEDGGECNEREKEKNTGWQNDTEKLKKRD